MIQVKTQADPNDRDPSVYLGIDGTVIPFNFFKGVYFEDGLIFTDDAFYGVQFYVSKINPFDVEDFREEGVSLVTLEPDMYVTLEDVQSTDKWMKIGHTLGEYSTMICGMHVDNFSTENKKAKKRILEKYYAGVTGLLSESSKVYDEEGLYYMWNFQEFKTKIEGESLRDRVCRHARFVEYCSDTASIWRRENRFEMHTKKKLWQEYVKLTTPQNTIPGMINDAGEVNPDNLVEVFFTSIYDHGVGNNVEFVKSKRNDFIIKLRKD